MITRSPEGMVNVEVAQEEEIRRPDEGYEIANNSTGSRGVSLTLLGWR